MFILLRHPEQKIISGGSDMFGTEKEVKPVYPVRPQGEWLTRHKQNSFGQDVVCFECNKCGDYKLPIIHTLITEPLEVCPNCGADMKKGGW